MGLDEFYINSKNTRNKIELQEGIRREDLQPNLLSLFDSFDKNSDGFLLKDELASIFSVVKNASGSDNVFDARENNLISDTYGAIYQIDNVDIQGFVKEISSLKKNIVSSKEETLPGGLKKTVLEYSDGKKTTLVHYPDGELKYSQTERKEKTTRYYEMSNPDLVTGNYRVKVEVSKEYYQKREKELAEIMEAENLISLDYFSGATFATQKSVQQDIKLEEVEDEITYCEIKISERALQELETQVSILDNYVSSHEQAKEYIDGMGFWDYLGAGLLHSWQSNSYLPRKIFGEKDFDIKDFFVNHYINVKGECTEALKLQTKISSLDADQTENPVEYIEGINTLYTNVTKTNATDTKVAYEFAVLSEQYQMASLFNSQIELIDAIIQELRGSYSVSVSGGNPYNGTDCNSKLSYNLSNKAKEMIKQLCGGDNALYRDIISSFSRNDGPHGEMGRKLDALKQEYQIYLDHMLKERVVIEKELPDGTTGYEIRVNEKKLSIDSLKNKYIDLYKKNYNVDTVPDELIKDIETAKMLGGFVKIAAVIAVTILITKNPQISSALLAAGGDATATGTLANTVRQLCSTYGQATVREAIRFGMTVGTIATDAGLTLLNYLTDGQEGVPWDEYGEQVAHTAAYIAFGTYVGGPAGEAVGKMVKTNLGSTSSLFRNGTKTVSDAATKTTLTGQELINGIQSSSKFAEYTAKAASFTTNVAAFTALDTATTGRNFIESLEEQGVTLGVIHMMSSVLHYMLGVKINASTQSKMPEITDAKMKTALDKSGVLKWKISEVEKKDANGKIVVEYEVLIPGQSIGKVYTNPDLIVADMVGCASELYVAMEVLGVTSENYGSWKKVYRELITKLHPDKLGPNPSEEMLADATKRAEEINAAKEVLEKYEAQLQEAAIPTETLLLSPGNVAPTDKATSSIESTALDKEAVITKYCEDQGLVFEDVMKKFNEVAEYLDDASMKMLLKLTSEGKVTLFTGKRVKWNRKDGLAWHQVLLMTEAQGVLDHLNAIDEQSCQVLKDLLNLAEQGKISAENIPEILKIYNYEINNFKTKSVTEELIEGLSKGEISESQIKCAQLMIENGTALKFLNTKNLTNCSKNDLLNIITELRYTNYKDYWVTNILDSVAKEMRTMTKINEVPVETTNSFCDNFANSIKVFEKENLSIDNLYKAGGVSLDYTRADLKKDIFKEIEQLSLEERNQILSKFGISIGSDGTINGLPICLKTEGLSEVESAINGYIEKFLSIKNRIVLPEGFEELAPFLNNLCEAIPEFKFAIGTKQHGVQKYNLAEHMLRAFQENMKNPLYQNLGVSDRKILGFATLLHDICKDEGAVTEDHPTLSSAIVDAIVERIPNLTPMERDRIINLVKNHHWLERLKDDDNNIIEDMVFTFRSGNDFNLAKIFAESDLKAVNDGFFNSYGDKLNSSEIQKIEDGILQLQSNGRMMFTARVNTHVALENGAVLRKVGSGSEATENIVIDAKQIGLDDNYFGYHAATDNNLKNLIAQNGFANGVCLSISIGKNGSCAVFGEREYFLVFDKLNMNTLACVAPGNIVSGREKSDIRAANYMAKDKCFVDKFRENYPHEISDREYALVFREAQTLDLSQISTDKNIQSILRSEERAKDFQIALEKTNSYFISTATIHSESLAFDVRTGAIGVKGTAENVSYEIRRLCAEMNIPIIENIE